VSLSRTVFDSEFQTILGGIVKQYLSVHTSVRPSVCFHSVFWINWPLYLRSCVSVDHDHSSHGI